MNTIAKIIILAFFLTACFKLTAMDIDPNGYLYGDVYLKSGSHYRGLIRWGKEEASWGDLFHSSKGEVTYKAYIPSECKKDKTIKVFGFKIATKSWDAQIERIFVARFGDIAEIRTVGTKSAEILMKSGRVYPVSGYSNDVSSKIMVQDESLGEILIPWQKLDKVVFADGKLQAGDFPSRIYGKVDTTEGSFEGFIQWDHDECIGDDELDGENDSGDFSIPFKNISTITKKSSSRVFVTMTDNRKLHLSGTNDVSKGNRGIYVDDPRFGKVDIPWRVFKHVEFKPQLSTGPSYSRYLTSKPLEGTVITKEKQSHHGFIAYDLDEMESWELLNGSYNEIGYIVPFNTISAISPKTSYSCRVTLNDGTSFPLEDKADVSEKNLGILVLKHPEDGEGIYTSWKNLAKINFDKAAPPH